MDVKAIAVPQKLAQALDRAGHKSGVAFDYLLNTAIRESSLNPNAKAPTSSATGLFQFIDSTWLQVMKEQGPALGYQKYADAITRGTDGDYHVADKAVRNEILALRKNPQAAADLAAAFTQANGTYLEERFGRRPSAGELYIAHFLGPQGAERLLAAGLADADQSAAALFSSQARANPTIFYTQGKPRTVKELYRTLVAQHADVSGSAPASVSGFAAQQLAAAPERRHAEPLPSRLARADMSFAALYATEPGPPARAPLLAIEALRSPVAPAAPVATAYAAEAPPQDLLGSQPALPLNLELGFAPLPAPAPLLPPGAPAAASLPKPGNPPGDAPKPRILMTPISR